MCESWKPPTREIKTTQHLSYYIDFPPPQAVDTSLGGTNDYTLLNSSVASGVTTISFSRLLNTGDSKDVVIGNSSMFLVWAYATTIGSGSTYPKHSATGSAMVNFLNAGNVNTPPNSTNATGGGGVGGQVVTASSNNTFLLQTIARTPQYVNPSAAFKAWWSIDSNLTVANITMQCNTTGWVGIGFSDYPVMAPADVVVSGGLKKPEKQT